MQRGVTSSTDGLKAVDWHNQSVDARKDAELKDILANNRDEEKEHAAMILERTGRLDPSFNKKLKDCLFTDKPLSHE